MQNATATTHAGPAAGYGAMLQHWRRSRTLSQLDLSLNEESHPSAGSSF